MWLTRLALRNPIFILMMSLMTVTLGWIALSHLSVDLFPNIDSPLVQVVTYYTGAGPQDIEKSITVPIERAVASSPGVEHIESTSKQGTSAVRVYFQYGTNLDNAQFDVAQRVTRILSQLPAGVTQPSVIKVDMTGFPILQIAVNGEGLDEKQLYDIAYNTIEPQIERIPGVASANVGGGKVREIDVQVRSDALRARGLAILDVLAAVRGSNLLFPSGDLRTKDVDFNVFSNTSFGSARPLRDVVVRQGDAATAPVRVSDVATVADGTADQTQIVRVDGQRGVYLRVLKQPGANTVRVIDDIKHAIRDLRGVPPNVKLVTAFDQSTYIRASIAALEHEALTGGLLAVAVILIFLVSFSATMIIGVAIPLSLIATFVLLFFTGQSLNVFTLGGMALGVGRLVDDSIVELENIHRHLALGQDRRSAVLNAAQEVAAPIFVSTITTIVVFFPVVFLTGVAKNLFIPLALTIAFALIMSFLVSRTVTPILCLKILQAEQAGKGHRISAWVTTRFAQLDDAYARGLRWVLARRFRVISFIFGVCIATVGVLIPRVGTEFFPDSDESQFQVIFKAPIGTRVDRTEVLTKRIEDTVKRTLSDVKADNGQPVVRTVISDTGVPIGRGSGWGNSGPHMGSMSVNLVPKSERHLSDQQIVNLLRPTMLREFPGMQVYFFVGGIQKRVVNFGTSAPIDVEVVGYDLEAGAAYAKKLAGLLRDLSDASGRPVLTDVQISREENYPELDVVVDREKAGRLGLNETQVAQTVLTSLVGSTQFSPVPYIDSRTGNQYYINVRAADGYRDHVHDLGELSARTPGGSLVDLANIATIKRSSGPVTVTRKYMQRLIEVTANPASDVSLGSAAAAVQEILDATPAPDGFTASQSGQVLAQKSAFDDLKLAAWMAIALVYMILASQFRSLVDPLVIMFSVPLGIAGVTATLWATGTTLSVNSFMGIIMMVGIVVSNGVLLVDFARILQSRGLPLVEAVVQAGKTRLRPILMTTIATIVGLMPMALGVGEGSETNLPLARAVIGGLAVSTVFTLFLIPSLYTLLERFSRSQHRDDTAGEPPAAASPAP
jgi:hydrophobe/amphiphile efflux-1 (HAE1) family protein